MRVGLNRKQRRAWEARARKCGTCHGRGTVWAREKSDDPTKPTPIQKIPCPGCSPFKTNPDLELLSDVQAAKAQPAAAPQVPAP